MTSAGTAMRLHCSHRGAARRAHLDALAAIAGSLHSPGAESVVLHCGDGPLPRALRAVLAEGGERVRVRLDGRRHVAQARRLAAGAVAFHAAGAGPVPRRGALALLYREAPVAAGDRCVGTSRCGLCVTVCKAGALSATGDDRPDVLGRACSLCGACVGACPWGAMGWTCAPAVALAARLDAILAAPDRDGPWALLLEERATIPGPGDWEDTEAPEEPTVLPLRLPPGTLGAAPVLRALELGASAVAVVTSSAHPGLGAMVEAIRTLLAAAGRDDVAVLAVRARGGATSVLAERLARAPPALPRRTAPDDGWDAMADTARLWQTRESASLELCGEGAWAGWVTAEAARCQLCARCARVCPTGALRVETGCAVSLTFQPGRCPAGCGRCARACPQGALRVAPSLRLPWRPQVLVPERRRACPRCGRDWEDAVALPGVARLLGGAGSAMPGELACPGCRRQRLSEAAARLFRRDDHGSDGTAA